MMKDIIITIPSVAIVGTIFGMDIQSFILALITATVTVGFFSPANSLNNISKVLFVAVLVGYSSHIISALANTQFNSTVFTTPRVSVLLGFVLPEIIKPIHNSLKGIFESLMRKFT